MIRERGLPVQMARAREKAAGASAEQARRLLNPTVEVRTENWRRSSDFSAASDLDVFATLTQPIETGGKRTARIGQAGAMRDAARAESWLTENAVTLEAVQAYLTLVRSRDRIETLRNQHAELEDIVSKMRLRVQEGYSPEADLKKFQAETAIVASQLVRAEMEQGQALVSLSALLGEHDPSLWNELPSPELPAIPGFSPDELARRALEKSPGVLAARARLGQARGALDLEKARRIPDLHLTAGYKRTSGLDTAVFGLGFPVPLFDTNAENVLRARSEEEAAMADLRAEELRATLAAKALHHAARLLQSRARLVEEELVEPAREARDAARVAFREGASDVLRLVDAERIYVEAQKDAFETRHEAFMKTVELRLAAGEEAIP